MRFSPTSMRPSPPLGSDRMKSRSCIAASSPQRRRTAGCRCLLTRASSIMATTAAEPELISIVGVKYTTARAVAERAVDLILRKLDRKPVRCRTADDSASGRRLERSRCMTIRSRTRFVRKWRRRFRTSSSAGQVWAPQAIQAIDRHRYRQPDADGDRLVRGAEAARM